jgi:hypothetical protein
MGISLGVFNTIEKPPNLDASRAQNLWTLNEDRKAILLLCGRIKFNNPHHTSLSTFGLIMILVFSGVLMLASLIALCLPAMPKINTWRPIRDWKRDDALALLAKTNDEVREISLLKVQCFAIASDFSRVVNDVWSIFLKSISRSFKFKG